MRLVIALLILTSLGSATTVYRTQVDTLWTDNFNLARPITDREGAPLPGGSVIQVGFIAGQAPSADPATFGASEWNSFVALTGDGSLNADTHPTTTSEVFPGFFTFSSEFNSEEHEGIPIIPNPNVLIAIRIFDGPTVAASENFNTASAPGWIMPTADRAPNFPFPGFADFDTAEGNGILVWESGDAGFATTLPVPEPNPGLSAIAVCFLLGRSRVRTKH